MNESRHDKRREQLDAIGRQMRDGIHGKIRRRRARNRIVAGASTLGVFGVVAVGALAQLPGGGGPEAVEPASAATVLERAARAAGFRPRELKAGEYLYTNTANVTRYGMRNAAGRPFTFTQREDTETWVGADKSGLIRKSGRHFATDYDKRAAEGAGYRPAPEHWVTEKIAPAGWFTDDSLAAATYTLPEADVTDELLEGYDLEDDQLVALARRQGKFNRYVRGRVRKVTDQLSSRKAGDGSIASNTNDATFSLAIELLSQPRQAHAVRLRAALLRLAATAGDDLKVDPNAHDLLGRHGVAVTETTITQTEGEPEEESQSVIVFDPETFVVLETRDQTGGSEPPPSTYPVGNPYPLEQATDYEYDIVGRLRERPGGQVVAPSDSVIETLR